MSRQEFRLFCEHSIDLRELWNNLVINALKFREKKISNVLKMRQEGARLEDKEIVLLEELEDDFIRATDELYNVCARINILAPTFTLNEICDLYV